MARPISSESPFETQLKNEIPKLRRYARALTRNAVTADDLLQNALLRALDKQHLYRPDTDLRAWLFTILRNGHVNAVRKAIREGNNVGPEALEYMPDHRMKPEMRPLIRDLTESLKKLNPEQREVILLVADGASYEQAAEILGWPIGTVRSRLARGRECLRLLMDGAEFDYDDLELLEWANAA